MTVRFAEKHVLGPFTREGRMKRLTVLFVVLMAVLSCVAVMSSGKQWTVAVCAAAIHHEFSLMINQGAVDTLKNAGVNVIFSDANGDELAQVAQVESAVQRGVDAIIIHGITDTALAGAVAEAGKVGIPIFAMDVPLTGPNVFTTVMSDNYMAGVRMARYLVGHLAGVGNVVLMYTPGTPVLDMRYKALRLVLADYPDIHVVAELPWQDPEYVQSSHDQMAAFLRAHPEKGAVNAVWAAADMPGEGAANAIQEAGRGSDIFVIGMDALPEALALIQAGPCYKMTLAQQPYEEGILAGQACLDHLAGKQVSRWIYMDVTEVTQDNANQFAHRYDEIKARSTLGYGSLLLLTF